MDNGMNELRAELQREAARVETAMEQDLARLADRHEQKLLEVLRYGLLGGGKRVRPFLVLQAAALCGREREESLLLAAAFEYLHGATLFHDDIIDQSELRRGRAAVHKKFGTVAAILAGDFLLAHSMEIVAEYTGRRGLVSFNQATRGMVDGEFWQLRNATDFALGERDYKEAVMRKTGLLIIAACEVGGLWGGGSDKELAALRCYGEGVGFAFQIIDDLLDYTGDSAKTGKAVGNDLQEGKITLPLILAIQSANNNEKTRLQQILQDRTLRTEKSSLQEVIQLIEKNGGFSAARNQAETAIKKGIEALDVFTSPAAVPIKQLLAALGEFILRREK